MHFANNIFVMGAPTLTCLRALVRACVCVSARIYMYILCMFIIVRVYVCACVHLDIASISCIIRFTFTSRSHLIRNLSTSHHSHSFVISFVNMFTESKSLQNCDSDLFSNTAVPLARIRLQGRFNDMESS